MNVAAPDIISPEVLEANLQTETDVSVKVRRIVEAINLTLLQIGSSDDIAIIRNIMGSLINQEEIYTQLFGMYEEIFTIWQRFRAITSKATLNEEDKQQIHNRASQIVGNQVFQLQREIFFKIVNAKEVAEGEKNEDGPALLFPAVETLKNGILKNLRTQTDKLRPAAIEICKAFPGISDRYAKTEDIKPGEKPKYDTIAQVYELEKALFQEIGGDVSAAQLNEQEFLNSLIKRFMILSRAYRLKVAALKDKQTVGVTNFSQKISLLKEGNALCSKCLKPLNVLKNLVERFPKLEKQLDFFAESQYQAKAVMQFLEEVNEEMSQVFKGYTLQSFTVVGLLRYKLNGTSHMYESIYYYFAVVQIEKDMQEALDSRYTDLGQEIRAEQVKKDLKQSGISDLVLKIHHLIADMNTANLKIHQAFLKYKENQDLDRLKALLADQTKSINESYEQVRVSYKSSQRIFLEFLTDDLGSTDLISQFDTFLKKNKTSEDAARIRKSFNKLLATKRNELDFLEKKLTEQFKGRLEPDKISAMAVLKIRKDFQKELLNELQSVERAQDIFIHILKEFIKIQDDQDNSHASDNSIVWLVQRNFSEELKQFKTSEAGIYRKILRNPYLSERDLGVGFLASNITPQEIESFSRLLPGLPRNELQLDSPFGRFLLDVKTMFKERLQMRGGSGEHVTEKVYEKRERMKLVNDIALFLKSSTDPFLKKIDIEEMRINHLISLQRRKYQKELNEVIRYWQYLVQKQISPGKGARGRFRRYSEEEKKLMMKYISPEQLNSIERQLEASYDLAADPALFEVESFLMEIADGLFKNFKEDMRIKEAFETYEKAKKIKQSSYQSEDQQNLLESSSFAPNIKECMARVIKLVKRDVIARYLAYWEYLIDQQVAASDRRKLNKSPKVEITTDSNNAVHYISDSQMQVIHQAIELIETIRDEEVKKQLIVEGQPVIKIAQQCFSIFKEGQKKLVLKEVDHKRQEKMKQVCGNTAFEKALKRMLIDKNEKE